MNEREENYSNTNPEESEYHFSDDDISYEVEPEGERPAAAAPMTQKENAFKKFATSRRLLISIGVFLFLVFIVYRMITSTRAPTTDITPVSATPPTPTIPNKPTNTVANTPINNAKPTLAPSASPMPPTAPAAPVTPVTPVATAMPVLPPVAPTTTSTVPQNVYPQASASSEMMPNQPPATPHPNTQPLSQSAPAGLQPGMMLPSGMPNTYNPYPSTPNPYQTAGSQPDTQMQMLQAQNERLMAQLQAEYNQHMAESANQNKAIQDQMQSLNSRVSNMETQLNDIYQAVNQQKTSAAAPSGGSAPSATRTEPVKIPYIVQAIIPGRAWLKADNGDTLTVAEGDTIKNVGRVEKIDPYDGIVQINTGHKIVSLSYGTGG